jgi:hypothetical protein
VALFILETLKRYTGSLTSKGVPDGYSNTHFILHVVQHYQYWNFIFPRPDLHAGPEPGISTAKQVYSHLTANL